MDIAKRNILVAPLNWGLGHASRCIPIIRELEKHNFNPIIASDGPALSLLKKEFPHVLHLELPSYQIEYSVKEANFKWKFLKNSPKIISAIVSEKKLIKRWCIEYNLKGIISDNRLGVFNNKIPSVIITHQLKVLSGNTTFFSTKIHQFFIKNFAECWVPDFKSNVNFSGNLGHLRNSNLNIHYIGTLSRLEKQEIPIKYDLMVLLSGPEPQRTILEDKLFIELKKFHKRVIFIRGIVDEKQETEQKNNITVVNFMTSRELETAMNQSEKILCRSGYTSIMDLIQLGKKAFFIPTPGQFEQEYLAKKMKRGGILPYSKQCDFKIEKIIELDFYSGFPSVSEPTKWKILFDLFESE